MPIVVALLTITALVADVRPPATDTDAAALVRAAAKQADGMRPHEALATAAEAERLATPRRDYAALSGVERVRAVVARHRGEQLQSLTHGETAVAHARRAGDPGLLSAALSQIATTYQDMGDWARTLDYARRAFEAHPSPTDLIRIQYLIQRGIVLHEFREGPESLTSFREALEIARRIQHQRYIGFALMEIGMTIWLIEGRPAEALPYFDEALQWARLAGAVTLEPSIFTNWGGALRDLGRYDEAVATFEKGLAVRPGGQPNNAAPVLLKNLGQTLALAGRPSEAQPPLREALALSDRMDRGHVRWQVRMELGMLLAATDPAQADRYFAESIKVLEAQNSNVLLENFRAGLFGAWLNKYDPFDRYIDFLLDRGERTRAFDVAERARARAFLDTLSIARNELARVLPPELTRRENELLAEISNRQTRLRTPELPPRERAALAGDVTTLEEQLAALRLRFASEHPGLAHARYPRLWTIDELTAKVMAADEYLLMFYVGRRQTTSWTIGPQGVTVTRLPARDELAPAVRAFVDGLRSPALDAGSTGDALRQALAPALATIPSGARLVIVPHGVLNYVPFEALRAADGEYLAVRHAVSYAPSASSFAFLRQHPGAAPAAGPAVLAIGNPSAAAPEAAAQRSETLRQVAYLKPLAWAGHELRQIAAIFGTQARVLQGRDATEASLAGAGIEHAAVLHFATHGLIDEEKPERSALALAAQPPFNDGMLQVREIYRWHLRAALVTLSACETALGRDVTGEGLVGLSRAFFSAGASAVAASLWSVDDAATTEYMRHFYTALKAGARIDDAARAARVRMIRDGGRFSSPYYWAGFIVSGNAASRIELSSPRRVAAAPFVWLALALAGSTLIVLVRRQP